MATYQTVVFFDLDGTLIVNPFERAVWPVVMGEIADKSGTPVETVRALIIEENQARQRSSSVSAVLAMDWDDITRTVAARLGVELEAGCESLVCQHAAAHSSLLENAYDVLRELNAPHRALVVATKGLAKYQLPVLDALGLTSLFAAVLTPDSYGALKKHAAFFGEWPSVTRLQIMVGDRYDDDVQAPGTHGFKTAWMPGKLDADLHKKDPFARALLYDYEQVSARFEGWPLIPADAIITSLAELPAVVRRMEQAFLGFSD